MSKDLKVTVVSFEEFSDIDFIPPATFFFKDALGNINFLHSSKREVCQEWVDENYPPKGKYKVIASKIQKGNGNINASGTNSRKGFSPNLRPTI
jgi:hypothetical protein